MEWDVFTPIGPTLALLPSSPAPAGILAPTPTTGPLVQYRIANTGTVTAWMAYGALAAVAQANAVIPSTGTTATSWPVLPGTVEIFTAPPGQFWSGVTAGASTAVYLTPGRGG